MTNGEAKKLETERVIFPSDLNKENQEIILAEEAAAEIIIDKPSIKADIQIRFARLKKSMRKRSASIL